MFIVLAYIVCASLSGALEYVGMLTVVINGGQDLLFMELWAVIQFSVVVLLRVAVVRYLLVASLMI